MGRIFINSEVIKEIKNISRSAEEFKDNMIEEIVNQFTVEIEDIDFDDIQDHEQIIVDVQVASE